MRAVAVYDHHPPHGFGVGFRDREPALADRTARDDASALALAERVAIHGDRPVRFVAKHLIIHVRLRHTEMTCMLKPQVDEHGVNGDFKPCSPKKA